MARRSLKSLFSSQKKQAKTRGIEFHLSFDEWVDWWGEDISRRGKGAGKLQMCRYNDEGPYSLENIYKGSHSENLALSNKLNPRKAKLDSELVRLIRFDLNLGLPTRKIASKYNTSQRTVMRVKLNQGVYK